MYILNSKDNYNACNLYSGPVYGGPATKYTKQFLKYSLKTNKVMGRCLGLRMRILGLAVNKIEAS